MKNVTVTIAIVILNLVISGCYLIHVKEVYLTNEKIFMEILNFSNRSTEAVSLAFKKLGIEDFKTSLCITK